MIRKVLRLHYSDTKIDFHVNNDELNVKITSSYVERNLVLNINFKFLKCLALRGEVCYKIEILNARDETVFYFLYLDNYEGCLVDIPSLCNITALKMRNPDLVSGNSKGPILSPPQIKMALTIGTKEDLLPLSYNINNLSSIQMLRSILNETAFDDPKIEAGAIGTIIESSVDRLRSVIDVQNAANILQLAQKYNVGSLKEVAAKFVADNFREVMETSGWKEMPDHLSKVLLSTILLSTHTSKNVTELPHWLSRITH